MPKLNTRRHFATQQRPLSPEEGEGLQENLLRLGLGVRGVLAEVPITIRELLELKPGNVISLGKPATAPAIIELEGVPRFTGRPGTLDRHRALRILSVLPKGEVTRDNSDRSTRARVYAP
jgi:flagellar motor switch protein FliM